MRIDSRSICKLILAWAFVVSQAVPVAADETKAADSSASTTTATPTTTPAVAPAKSGSDLDNFIPGSEMLPAPAKTDKDAEKFVSQQKPSLDLAMVLYKNCEYKQGLMVLEKLKPNEQVHYYQGLCYKGLGNVKAAQTHFAWVAYYAKDPKLKTFAFSAIRSMKPQRSDKVDRGGSTSTAYSGQLAKQRGEEAVARINAELRNKAIRDGY